MSGSRSVEPSDAVVKAWARLIRAQRHLLRAVERELKAAGHPPLAWYDALLELRRAPSGLRGFELEEKMLLEQYNLSRLVDRLVQAGLAEKAPAAEDRRGWRLVITKTGRATLVAMWPVYAAAIERHVGARLDQEEAAILARLLGKLLENETG